MVCNNTEVINTRGKRRKCPAFIKEDIDGLLVFKMMWSGKGRLAIEPEMRLLLGNYVELFLYNRVRHGAGWLGVCYYILSAQR